MSEKNKLSTKRHWLIFGCIIAVIVIIFLFIEASKYQSTDDAYVDTTTVTVAPKVSGQIVKVLVKDNQQVKAGDVVAVIDKVDYQTNAKLLFKLSRQVLEKLRTYLDEDGVVCGCVFIVDLV